MTATDNNKNNNEMEGDRPAAALRKLQGDQIQQEVISRGLRSAAIWGTAGVIGHFALSAISPRYARQRISHKTFAMLMIPTAAFFTTTDVAAMELDRKFAQQFSITPKLAQSSDIKEEGERQLLASRPAFTKEWAVEYFRVNQYQVIGYTWLTLVGGSLLYNFASPRITMAQKFINARLVSQTGAMLGIVAVAALNVPKLKTQERDLYFEHAISHPVIAGPPSASMNNLNPTPKFATPEEAKIHHKVSIAKGQEQLRQKISTSTQ